MRIAEQLLADTDWARFTADPAKGDTLAAAIASLIGADDPAQAQQAWWGIENTAFAQDTIYPPAEPTIDVMLAALIDDRPRFVREWIIEVLFFAVHGESADDPGLQDRCRKRGHLGLWLLAQEARAASEPERQRVLAVIDLMDAPFGATLRRVLEDD